LQFIYIHQSYKILNKFKSYENMKSIEKCPLSNNQVHFRLSAHEVYNDTFG